MNRSKTVIFILSCIALVLLVIWNVSSLCISRKKNKTMSEKQAINIAIDDLNADKDNIDFTKCNLEYDDGRYVYDVELIYDNTRYEYEIKGDTGDIISVDKELISDIS